MVTPAPDVVFHPRSGASPPYRPTGPNGERYCRWCAQQITAKRRTLWCGQACVDSYSLHTPQGVRAAVWNRDRGICALCGLDTLAAKQMMPMEASHWWEKTVTRNGSLWWRYAICERYLRMLRVPRSRLHGDWWDADHIVPARDGGPLTLENLRTLCLRCHVRRTSTDRRRR